MVSTKRQQEVSEVPGLRAQIRVAIVEAQEIEHEMTAQTLRAKQLGDNCTRTAADAKQFRLALTNVEKALDALHALDPGRRRVES